MDQWNRTESPEKHSRNYGSLIFNEGGKNKKIGKRQSLQQVVLEKSDSCV